MPYKYFPFDSTFTGVDSNGIPQGDRGATSADWAAYVSRMFTDGYFKLLDDQLEPSLSATPMAVDIAAGSAMIKGRQYSQDETVTVSLGLSDSQPRIDRIVLRMSTEVADRKISLVVLKGIPAASPVAPALTRTASVYEICLTQIAVGANVVQIIEDNLTDTRDNEALCGYVKILLDGRYYPNGSIPELLWVYSMYPETLTPEQKAFVESNTEFMDIYEASKIRQVDIKTIQNKLAPGTVGMFIGDGVLDGFVPANGAELSQETYADLYKVIKHKYGVAANFGSYGGDIVTINGLNYVRNGNFTFVPVDIEDETVYAAETGSAFALSSPFTGGDSQGQFGLAIVGDSYYTIGGETVASGTGTAVVHCRRTKFLDKTTVTTWGNMPALPIARSMTAVAVYNNKYIYSIGGQPSHGNATQFGVGQTQVYKVEILPDSTLSSWSEVTALITGVTWSNALILGNKLYTFGGATTPNGMSDPYSIQNIRVATIDPHTGNLSAWSEYGMLPTATKAYGTIPRVMEGKVYILQNNVWYFATISGDGFSTFSTVAGFGPNDPVGGARYRNGYLYYLTWQSSSYALKVMKYANGAFTLITSAATLGNRTVFKIPDLRNGAISFASALITSVAATGGGVYNQGNPLIRPIPCLKY